MADQANNGTPPSNPPANSGGGGGQFTVPQGQRLISEDDYGRLSRYEQQVRGFAPLAERATKFGITKAEDFDAYEKWKPVIDGATKRKLGPQDFTRFVSDEPAQGHGDERQRPDFDQEKFESDLMTKVEAKAAAASDERYALKEHEAALKAEPDVFKSVAKSVLGKASEYEIETFADRLMGKVRERPTYPDGHPLAGKHYAPFTAQHLEEHAKALKKKDDGYKAATLASKGAELSSKSPSSIAGDVTQQGKPTNQDGRRPGGLPSHAQIEAKAAEIRARKGRSG